MNQQHQQQTPETPFDIFADLNQQPYEKKNDEILLIGNSQEAQTMWSEIIEAVFQDISTDSTSASVISSSSQPQHSSAINTPEQEVILADTSTGKKRKSSSKDTSSSKKPRSQHYLHYEHIWLHAVIPYAALLFTAAIFGHGVLAVFDKTTDRIATNCVHLAQYDETKRQNFYLLLLSGNVQQFINEVEFEVEGHFCNMDITAYHDPFGRRLVSCYFQCCDMRKIENGQYACVKMKRNGQVECYGYLRFYNGATSKCPTHCSHTFQ